jgi:hypothetical protein
VSARLVHASASNSAATAAHHSVFNINHSKGDLQQHADTIVKTFKLPMMLQRHEGRT